MRYYTMESEFEESGYEHSKVAMDILEDIRFCASEFYADIREKGWAKDPFFLGHFFLRRNKICFSDREHIDEQLLEESGLEYSRTAISCLKIAWCIWGLHSSSFFKYFLSDLKEKGWDRIDGIEGHFYLSGNKVCHDIRSRYLNYP